MQILYQIHKMPAAAFPPPSQVLAGMEAQEGDVDSGGSPSRAQPGWLMLCKWVWGRGGSGAGVCGVRRLTYTRPAWLAHAVQVSADILKPSATSLQFFLANMRG